MSHNNVNRGIVKRIVFHDGDIYKILPIHCGKNLILVVRWIRGRGSRINVTNLTTGDFSCGLFLPHTVKNVVSFLDVKTGDLKIAIASGLTLDIYAHKNTTFYLQETIDLNDRRVNAVHLLCVGSDILVIRCDNAVLLAYSSSHPLRYLDGLYLDGFVPIYMFEPIIVDRTIYMLAMCKSDNTMLWIRWQPTRGHIIGESEKKRNGCLHHCASVGPFLAEFYPDQNRIDMIRLDNLRFSHSLTLDLSKRHM
jgi:hypothetical protein